MKLFVHMPKIAGTSFRLALEKYFTEQQVIRYFELQNIITFVRKPMIRICSEYLHRRKNGTFTGSFSRFIQTPGFQNTQSKFLEGICTDSMVDITEHYRESPHQLNSEFGWKMKARKKNVSRNKGRQRFADTLPMREQNLFYKMKRQDMEFYQNELQRFTSHEAMSTL